jgi:hypothetical protein
MTSVPRTSTRISLLSCAALRLIAASMSALTMLAISLCLMLIWRLYGNTQPAKVERKPVR